MQPELDWDQLNWCQINAIRKISFDVIKMNNFKGGLNCLANKFHTLNRKIPLDWLNKSWNSNKVKCKNLFITTK
jgi:hypothetical protein